MELKDVLEAVPGLERRFVYYLESCGYIRPAKVQKQRISRREYRQEDLDIIREVWRYYQRGYSLQSAYGLASTTQRTIGYLGVQAHSREVPRALEHLKAYPQVTEAAVVYGTDVDLILKTDTPDQSEVYHTLVPLLAEIGITALPYVAFITGEPHRRDGTGAEKGDHPAMLAYLLIKVPVKNIEDVMEQLKGYESITEASTVYGESDIIAKVEVSDQEALDRLVMEQIHAIPAVESTRTFVAVQKLHWSRQP